MIDLILKDIQDPYIRENFFRLSKFLGDQTIFDGKFEFFEIEFNQSNTIVDVAHGLNFIPVDIVILSVIGDYNLYFDHVNFTSTHLKVFVEGPCKLRFLAGSFKNKNYGNRLAEIPFIPPNAASGVATTWYTGVVSPASGLGDVGDFYLNTLTGDVYYKSNPTTWVSGYNILDNRFSANIGAGLTVAVDTVALSTFQRLEYSLSFKNAPITVSRSAKLVGHNNAGVVTDSVSELVGGIIDLDITLPYDATNAYLTITNNEAFTVTLNYLKYKI